MVRNFDSLYHLFFNADSHLESSVPQASTSNIDAKIAIDSNFDVVGPKLETHTEQAEDELRLLLKVIETHLSRQIAFHDSLSTESGKVRFIDLWHVFKPGYEIRSPGTSQIQL